MYLLYFIIFIKFTINLKLKKNTIKHEIPKAITSVS